MIIFENHKINMSEWKGAESKMTQKKDRVISYKTE